MRFALIAAAAVLGLAAASPSAKAVGCFSGGVAGAVAGHMAGHGVLGAMVAASPDMNGTSIK